MVVLIQDSISLRHLIYNKTFFLKSSIWSVMKKNEKLDIFWKPETVFSMTSCCFGWQMEVACTTSGQRRTMWARGREDPTGKRERFKTDGWWEVDRRQTAGRDWPDGERNPPSIRLSGRRGKLIKAFWQSVSCALVKSARWGRFWLRNFNHGQFKSATDFRDGCEN